MANSFAMDVRTFRILPAAALTARRLAVGASALLLSAAALCDSRSPSDQPDAALRTAHGRGIPALGAAWPLHAPAHRAFFCAADTGELGDGTMPRGYAPQLLRAIDTAQREGLSAEAALWRLRSLARCAEVASQRPWQRVDAAVLRETGWEPTP